MAPGTFGAAAGVAVFAVIAPLGILPVVLAATALLAAGVWAADRAERIFGREDDGRIVIDEVVGQLIALAPAAAMAPALRRSPVLLLAGFLAFRLFDIWKPGPVRAAERGLPGGLGVMLDDVVAGLLAAAGVLVLALALGARAS